MKQMRKNEDGLAIVEATILLPFCMIMVIALFYAAIFLCQKANLQANLQNTLIYYKNTYSDSYVTVEKDMKYTVNDTNIAGTGSGYSDPKYLFPYRFFFMSFNKDEFSTFFKDMCGYMFFDDGSNVEVTVDKHNYVVYKSIEAKATQTIVPAINLAMVGGTNEMIIEVTGTAVVSDGDEFIRDVDFAIDIIEDTKVGEWAKEAVGKVTEFYNSFKEKLHI
ncbi:MAG: hypothetical protein IJ716_11535 [Lachnospiraceae bacterium]|nr:hypothetical protein [Lachnospiraceae bacterium]